MSCIFFSSAVQYEAGDHVLEVPELRLAEEAAILAEQFGQGERGDSEDHGPDVRGHRP